VDQLRLVVPPKSVIDTSCRIFSPADKPKNHANQTTFFTKSKDETWDPTAVYIKNEEHSYHIVDDNVRDKCPAGYLLLKAKNHHGKEHATCVQNSVDASKVALVIEDNGFHLKEVRYGIVEPVEQGLHYVLPGENYHAVQGDFADAPEKKEKLQPQVSGFTKAE
jgi:hypothetical protein